MSFVKFLVILLALFAMLAGLALIYLDVKTRKRKSLALSDDLHDKDGIPVVPRHLRKFSHDEKDNEKKSEVDIYDEIIKDDGASESITETTTKTTTGAKVADSADVKQQTEQPQESAKKETKLAPEKDIQDKTIVTDTTNEKTDNKASDLDKSSESLKDTIDEQTISDKQISKTDGNDDNIASADIKDDKVEDFKEEHKKDKENNKENIDTSDLSDKVVEEQKDFVMEQAHYTTAQIPAKVKISNAHTDTGLFYDYGYGPQSVTIEDTSSQNDSKLTPVTEGEGIDISSVDDSLYETRYQSQYDASSSDPARVHTSAFKKGFDISRFADNTPLSDEELEKTAEVDQNSPLTHAKDNLNISILPIDEFSHISGEQILQMVDDFGFKYGAMNMFHRYQDKDGSGVLWFSMMALTNDGIKPFDINTLPTSMDIKGLVMFLPLPHPKVLQGFDSMMSIAGLIAREIDGFIVDEDGNEITTDYKKRLRALLQSSLED